MAPSSQEWEPSGKAGAVQFAMPAPRIDAAMDGLWREVLTLAPPEPTRDTEPTPDTEPSTGFQET